MKTIIYFYNKSKCINWVSFFTLIFPLPDASKYTSKNNPNDDVITQKLSRTLLMIKAVSKNYPFGGIFQ